MSVSTVHGEDRNTNEEVNQPLLHPDDNDVSSDQNNNQIPRRKGYDGCSCRNEMSIPESYDGCSCCTDQG